MNYFLLFVTTVALAMQSVFAKQYQRKVKGASVLFAALSALLMNCALVWRHPVPVLGNPLKIRM